MDNLQGQRHEVFGLVIFVFYVFYVPLWLVHSSASLRLRGGKCIPMLSDEDHNMRIKLCGKIIFY